MTKTVIEYVASIISIYIFLVVIRIAITWIAPDAPNTPRSILPKLCDPYLNLFKQMKLTYNNVDFSPVFAVTILIVVGNMLSLYLTTEQYSLGIFLSFLLTALWSAFAGIAFFLIVFIVMRLSLLFFKSKAYSPILANIDTMLSALAEKVASIIFKPGTSTYQTNLMFLCVITVAFYFLGDIAISYLAELLKKIAI